VIGELLGCSDEVSLSRASAHPLGDPTQRGVRLRPRGREELIGLSRRWLLSPEMGWQRSVWVVGVGVEPGCVKGVLPAEFGTG